MTERRCILVRELRFDSGLTLPRGTPIYVDMDSEDEVAALAHFYPDPLTTTAHAFAVRRADYSVLVNGTTEEQYLVVTEEAL